jgi:hypothetical protein
VIKKHAKLTDLGIMISEEIDYVIVLMDKLFKEINPGLDVIKNAKIEQIKHFKMVNEKYINLEY